MGKWHIPRHWSWKELHKCNSSHDRRIEIRYRWVRYITVASHGVANQWQLGCLLNNWFGLKTNKISKLLIIGPLCGESSGDSLGMEWWCKHGLHVMTPYTIWSCCSSPPNATYRRRWSGTSLVYIMACRLFGANPLSKPMMTSHQSHLVNRLQWNISELSNFHRWNCTSSPVILPPFSPGERILNCWG